MSHLPNPASSPADRVTLRVMVYASDSGTRRQVIGALGTSVHPDLPELEFIEVATDDALFAWLDADQVDLAILDGEASPAGGMGVAKQIRDEYEPSPPTLVLVAREADRWLADWSRADAVATLPVDPLTFAREVTALLRRR